MRETVGNLWTYPAEVRVITTNGSVRRDGKAIMGRGCAKEAADQWPKLPEILGRAILLGGNQTRPLGTYGDAVLVSLPVKHLWPLKADIVLIIRSVTQLVHWADEEHWGEVVMPRPGCGNGGLDWGLVKGVIKPLLDDRFMVITYG